jgi:hypothetical protein
MNIYGAKNRVKKCTEKIEKLIGELNQIQNAIARARGRSVMIDGVSYTIAELREVTMPRLQYYLSIEQGRRFAITKKLKEEILKRKKRRKQK